MKPNSLLPWKALHIVLPRHRKIDTQACLESIPKSQPGSGPLRLTCCGQALNIFSNIVPLAAALGALIAYPSNQVVVPAYFPTELLSVVL